MTLYLYGDIQTIYHRERQRDQRQDRHRGHLVNCYHRDEAGSPEPTVYDAVPGYDDYCRLLRERNYNVAIGHTIAVDVTDLGTVSCEQIVRCIREYIERGDQIKVEYTWLSALEELEGVLKMQRNAEQSRCRTAFRSLPVSSKLADGSLSVETGGAPPRLPTLPTT